MSNKNSDAKNKTKSNISTKKKNTKMAKTVETNETNTKKVKKVEINEVNTKTEINSTVTDLNKKIYFGFVSRIITYILLLIIVALGFSYFFINGIKFRVNYDLDYEIKSGINYKVYLKDNEYYSEKYLTEGMQYITSLIDYVDANLTYEVKTSKKSDYNYSYNITADLIITDKNDLNKVLYKKSETLKEPSIIQKDLADNIKINENLKIDYNKYNALANSFKSSYILSANSSLKITMHVDTIVKNNNVNNDIKDNEDLVITIPLSEQTISVSKDFNEPGQSGTISQYSNIKIVNYYYFALSIVFIVLSIIILINLLKLINRMNRKNSLYNKAIKRINKEYDQIIVTLNKMPNLENYQIIEVSTFEELLDAKQNLDKPILHIEIHRNQKSYYMIISGNEVYRYTLKEVDLKNEKKS